MQKIMTIFGTRPEGIKMAPVIQTLQQDQELDCVCVNTAQHREMLDQVLALFSITPDYDLNLMQAGQNVEDLIGEMLIQLTAILQTEKPDMVLVHGDTSTTFIGAYAAFMQKIPVGHVEAGLRTHNIYSPFPEEMNRQMVGRIASYHFAATEKNKANLQKEATADSNVYVVGNTVIDALLDITSRKRRFNQELEQIFSTNKKTILLTTHRRENLDELENVYLAINQLVEQHEDVQVVFPIHKNPVIRQKVQHSFPESERVHFIEPLDYETFVHVMKESYLIITDSGGIQEEAPALGKPVLVARKTTERQEGIEAGTLKLVGTSKSKIYEACHHLLTDKQAYQTMAGKTNPFGTGATAKKIVRIIKAKLLEESLSSNNSNYISVLPK
ncbi:MAG TPA: UDP-N-acetylglucosamine 2-epimerase (non-hydrolyzing) [Pseudogracilibacillus sp.]|nr:UDP-N-acetylglucosamine 2-epimerase (non-hydrolyzing) [Pseudogracilibacillus sp.]